jgi:type I restriction enzyme S subunit
VNFHFPNYEHTEFDGESGLPVGWRKGKVADLCEVKSGYAFKSKDWQTEGNPVMKIKNITNNTVDINDCDYVDDEVAKNAEKFELFEGDVLIAMTGATVGKVGLIPKIDKRIYINQRVGLFRPFSEIENNVYLVFSFFMTDEAQKQILNFAGGAAQPNISSSQISEVELNIGSDEVLKMFESKIQSIMVQIQTLYSQNQKLKEARDILLPRLMNRTIEV